MKKLLTKKEVSKMLGKSLRSVDRLNIPVEATMGRTLLFSEDVVKKYIPNTESKPVKPRTKGSWVKSIFGESEPELVFATPKYSEREETILKAMKLAKEGKTDREIQKLSGLPRGSVGYYVKRFNIKRPKTSVIVADKRKSIRWDLLKKELNA